MPSLTKIPQKQTNKQKKRNAEKPWRTDGLFVCALLTQIQKWITEQPCIAGALSQSVNVWVTGPLTCQDELLWSARRVCQSLRVVI